MKQSKTGKPIEKRSYGEEFERECFLMGMFNLAMGSAGTLFKALITLPFYVGRYSHYIVTFDKYTLATDFKFFYEH